MSIPQPLRAGKGPYRMLPDRMLFDTDRIQDGDIRLWGVMAFNARFRGYCDSTDDQLAAALGVSPQTVRRCLKRLDDHGYIFRGRGDAGARRIELRPDGDGKAGAGPGIKVVG